MDQVSATHHLKRRNGVFYYRRRVPDHLVAAIGKRVIQFSLDTKSLKDAKARREVADIEWSARFASAEVGHTPTHGVLETTKPGAPLSDRELTRLVSDHVAHTDARFQTMAASDPPCGEEQKAGITADIETGLQILKNRDDPRGDQWVQSAGRRILQGAGIAPADLSGHETAFHERVRRALLEIDTRRLARVGDDNRHAFFDRLFENAGQPDITFGELAAQVQQQVEEEARANRTSQKWIDKQRATLALIREIVGSETLITAINYDACMRVRSTLASVPTNRSKPPFKGLTLAQAIALADAQKKPVLSSTSQRFYLTAFKSVLDLASRKRLIAVNPAADLGPMKRDDISPGDKRQPFTLEQIAQFFKGDFYQRCAASGPVPYRHDTRSGWRFWLPLICLFSGLRPNEVLQLHVADVRHTTAGVPYFDIVTSPDDDEGKATGKTLKTSSSRRRVPVHPELIKIGLLQFVAERRATISGLFLFSVAPDRYGNRAAYPLRRFRDDFLPRVMKLTPRQTFYSFRHSFRDALRRIGAPADALQALGGWSQGKLVSDDYGQKADPNYQARYINGIEYPGLDLAHLHMKT